MSDEEILLKSSRIRREASKILKMYELSEILKGFEFEIIGSYKLDLMYDRDIDIVVKSNNVEVDSYKSLKKIIKSKQFMKVQYGDFINFPRENRPKGYIINLFLEYKEKLWEIEIWFLDDINSSLKEMIQIENKLNQKNKLNILKEKKKRDKFNISKKELSSYKIYKDILNL